MHSAPEGEPFRCDRLDDLSASHQKLERPTPSWWTSPTRSTRSPLTENAGYLGAIEAWSRRHNRLKMWGFYADLIKTGAVMAPTDAADEESLRDAIAHVHQIGWQLRLGEHIEGKMQDEQEAGVPWVTEEDVAWMKGSHWAESPPEVRQIITDLVESIREGTPGQPLRNAVYSFDPPGADRSAGPWASPATKPRRVSCGA